MAQSYNVLVNRFEQFVANHAMLRRFSHGRIAGVDLLKDGLYPLLHIDPQGFTIDNQVGFNVQVYILDKPRDKDDFLKQEYQREVISDCQRIMEQLVAEIQNGGNVFLFSENWSVETPTTSETLIESYNHVLTGVQATLTITAPWGIDACLIPVIPNPLPPAPITCDDATVNVNGNLFDTVASGGTLDVLVEYQNGTPVGTISGDTVVIPNPATCADATVENSDDTYSDTVASGATLVLPDTTYNFYLDGVLADTQTIPSIKNETFNIVWQ